MNMNDHHRRDCGSSSTEIIDSRRPRRRFKVGKKVLSCFGPTPIQLPCAAKVREVKLSEDGTCWRYLLEYTEWLYDDGYCQWVDEDVLVKYSERNEDAVYDAAFNDIKRDHPDPEIWKTDAYKKTFCDEFTYVTDAAWKKASLRNRRAAVENLKCHDAEVERERQKRANLRKNASLQKHQPKPQNNRDILLKAIAGKKLSRTSLIEAQERVKSLPSSRLKHKTTLPCDTEQA